MNSSEYFDQGPDRQKFGHQKSGHQKPTEKNSSDKQHYVDPPSSGVKGAHTPFESQGKKQEVSSQALDARESLDIPLASLKEFVEKYKAPKSDAKPGIDRPPGAPSMPDPDSVSQLPETEREKRYMVQEAHSPAGPHIVIDTPVPEGNPTVDSFECSLQRASMDELVPLADEEELEVEAGVSVYEASADFLAAPTILEVMDLKKSYRKASIEIPVLRGVGFAVKAGQFVSIVGQSGSGKSTLLHLLGTLDSPDTGQIYFHGHRVDNLSSRSRDMFRNDKLGMIFQSYHLLPELNVLENVLSPLLIRESLPGYILRRRAHRRRAIEIIEAVGLGHRLKHRPRELSGGEMQRTAIARALVSQPELLLADEPTGNLDQETGAEIMELLGRLNREQNLTIVMVTHDQALAEAADQRICLVDGRVV